MTTMTLPMVVVVMVMLITIIATVTNISVGKIIFICIGSMAMLRQLHYDLATTTTTTTTTGSCTATYLMNRKYSCLWEVTQDSHGHGKS